MANYYLRLIVLFIDEAHHIKTVADNFLGESLSSRQIQNLLDDIRNEDGIADTPELLMRLRPTRKCN